MPDFPALTHVAVTVTDLDRSREWYRALFGSDPVLDEDTGAFHHVVWLMGSLSTATDVGVLVEDSTTPAQAGAFITLVKKSASGTYFGISATKDGVVTYCRNADLTQINAHAKCTATKW